MVNILCSFETALQGQDRPKRAVAGKGWRWCTARFILVLLACHLQEHQSSTSGGGQATSQGIWLKPTSPLPHDFLRSRLRPRWPHWRAEYAISGLPLECFNYLHGVCEALVLLDKKWRRRRRTSALSVGSRRPGCAGYGNAAVKTRLCAIFALGDALRRGQFCSSSMDHEWLPCDTLTTQMPCRPAHHTTGADRAHERLRPFCQTGRRV